MQCALFETVLLNASHSSLPRAQIPSFLYGCAWKKDKTTDLVSQALASGFKGIDVAAQPRHYREELAGEGMRRAIADGKVQREDLFVSLLLAALREKYLELTRGVTIVKIQTKFTSVDGQDPTNLPYDPSSSITTQVRTSIASSLHNLRHSDGDDAYIDSLVLHSPLRTIQATQEAWRACEEFVPNKVRSLGISNTTLPLLESLYKSADIKPAVVQNRFHADTGYDVALRRFCREKRIIYQSFWTLTANPHLLRHKNTERVAKAAQTNLGAAFYALVMGLEGTIVLNGTQNHMQEDIQGLQQVREWVLENPQDWATALATFKDLIGERG